MAVSPREPVVQGKSGVRLYFLGLRSSMGLWHGTPDLTLWQ